MTNLSDWAHLKTVDRIETVGGHSHYRIIFTDGTYIAITASDGTYIAITAYDLELTPWESTARIYREKE
jgi:hypothetical protein